MSALQAFQDEQLHAHVGTEAIIAPASPVNKSSKENSNCKVLGRMLAASLCMFMLVQDRIWGDTTQKDINHPLGLCAGIVCGMICGVAMKVTDLTQEHGLRISTAMENMCFFVVVLDIFVLSTVVPGGQSVIACIILFHGLIKGKADTRKHLIIAAIVYIVWIFLTWKGLLSVDWLFISVTVGIGTLWAILNNRLLHMGDTFVNQFSVHNIFLMANFVIFSYDRFVAPALIMLAEIFAYATTKIIAKTQTWYITSKREELVPKNYLTIELLTGFGGIQWLLVYILMLWEGVRLGIGTWPVSFGSYWLMWEFLDSFLDYFNKGAYTSKRFQLPKRMLYAFYCVLDVGLHILFVLYGLGMPTNEFGLGIPQTVPSRFLYLAALLAMWTMVLALCRRFGLGRQIKYFGYAIQCVQHASLVRLPAYSSSPLLMQTAWATALGNLCYVAKIWSPTFPKPKMVFSVFSIGLVVLTLLFNIFQHELRAMPAVQYSLITGTSLIIAIAMTFGHHWWKDKTCY